MANEIEKNNGEIIIYQSEDGKIRIDVRLENKTVWLTQEQIATLFSKGRTTITEHISNIFKEGELDREKVCRKIRHTTQHGALEGKTQSQEVTLYNLDVIISVGYRIRIFRLCGNSGSQTSPDVYGRQLDNILSANGEELLVGTGSVSHEEAIDKALAEYRKFQVKTLSL